MSGLFDLLYRRSEVEKQIVKARPSLKAILPVVFWQTAVFSGINLSLGLGMFLWRPTIFISVAPNLPVLRLWSVLFAIAGLLLAWGLYSKRWETLRGIMSVTLFYMLIWSLALLLRIRDGGTFLVAALFIGLSALLAVVIIYYLPPDEAIDGKTT